LQLNFALTVIEWYQKLNTMANQEEQNNPNENQEQNNPANNQSQEVGNESTSSGGHKSDPEHNTGNDRMRIDEEGAEIKPDDEV